ncbi:GNAT family N-acetyltransferase [Brevibacillus sp. NSP2.1]|uniref:GNAT family N-acetyltransferase n=1 Tax=Brevibacillus sp. NSP2.1 TaxID=3003229 RepID=UPI0004198416|nr:GNAT family protein [Brevibacillus sp. NSP2.1]QHZ56439.1 GNAT family N-acetyltransferase [Brevibacillus sp. NSP2.1]
MRTIEPVTLEGKRVRLEPLLPAHVDGIFAAGAFPPIWSYMSVEIQTREDAQAFIEQALKNEAEQTELPFAIVNRADGQVIGSTRFLAISRKDRGLEIGFTWLTPAVWKTAVNTECKWLLLRHCFEELGCIRVQLKTDARNLNSQRAIARIGGIREGVLRNHMVMRDGYIRDSVYFSILDREWPEVKQRLEMLLFGE